MATRSPSRWEYPHSLSYHPCTFTIVLRSSTGITMVRRESKVHDAGLPTMSDDTMGSSVYSSTFASGPDDAAAAKASLTSWAVTAAGTTAVKSVIDPTGTGTRRAVPSSFPFIDAITRLVARAAP